ncbi:MAG: protein kinase [Aggregatilineales bacterium]
MDVGVKINQYTIVEHIGRGGMADVWSARDERLNRMVALKTIAHGLSQEVDPVGLFKREAQTIAKMEHPHILPIYDFGEYAGQLYIVMRFVAGGSLDEILERGPMPVNEVLRLGDAVASALDYAHSAQIIHLDLKPPNILMDSQQAPYLADFGLATKLDPGGKANNPGAGTLLYMAPEQLTAEMIDHRADIYSFTILLYHMLAGVLPFNAESPLALRQLQYHEDLPDITEKVKDLPLAINEILRQGTALDPEDRPDNLHEILESIRSVVAPGAMLETIESVRTRRDGYYTDALEYFDDPDPMSIQDLELLEAADIYARARHAWAGGNGRFLLGVTHFMIMNGYYMDAEKFGLELDLAGMQMILRGALEYEINIDFWWNHINDDDSRRWVCLHAIRSGNAPARVRALYRIETLPDSEPPQIPRLVAQALQIENNQEARLAALQVLSTRAKLRKHADNYTIETEFRGRMLTTMTRLGIQISTPNDWLEVIYTPEIDLLIAETAMDYSMPEVAEFAARVIGRIRSTAAIRFIVNEQKKGRRGALRALALIRDETPSLPPVVNTTSRFYAWTNNSLRRMFDHPLKIVWRYVFALIGAWIAMGYHVYTVYRTQALFTQQRWANAIAIGLIFAILVAFVPLFADEFSTRLRNFWHGWLRLLAGLVIATLWGAFAWWSLPWFFLNLQPGLDLVLFGGFMTALGFSMRSMLNLKSWLAVPLTVALIFAPIFITFYVGWMYQDFGFFTYGAGGFPEIDEALLYYTYSYGVNNEPLIPAQLYNVGILFALLISIGGYLPHILSELHTLAFGDPDARKRREVAEIQQEKEKRAPVTEVPNLDTISFDVKANQPVNMDTMPLSEMESQIPLESKKQSRLELKTITDMQVVDFTKSDSADTDNMDYTTRPFDANPAMPTQFDVEFGEGDYETDDEMDSRIATQKQRPSILDMKTVTDVNVDMGMREQKPPSQDDLTTRDYSPNPDMKTQLDPEFSLNRFDDDNDEDTVDIAPEDMPDQTDNKPVTKRVDIGTGIKINPNNMQTELDVNKGSETVSYNEEDDDKEDDK